MRTLERLNSRFKAGWAPLGSGDSASSLCERVQTEAGPIRDAFAHLSGIAGGAAAGARTGAPAAGASVAAVAVAEAEAELGEAAGEEPAERHDSLAVCLASRNDTLVGMRAGGATDGPFAPGGSAVVEVSAGVSTAFARVPTIAAERATGAIAAGGAVATGASAVALRVSHSTSAVVGPMVIGARAGMFAADLDYKNKTVVPHEAVFLVVVAGYAAEARTVADAVGFVPAHGAVGAAGSISGADSAAV